MYAIIETGGKQIKVEKGIDIYVEKLEVNDGEEFVFDKVLLVADEKSAKLGNPYVKGASVSAKVIKQGKEKKIVIFKYKQKNGSSHRKQGHRQPYTKLMIEEINVNDPSKRKETVEVSVES